MDRSETNLPVVTLAQTAYGAHLRTPPESEFVTQLIAERDRLPPQRERRRAPLATALDAYREGAGRGVPHLPRGFFTERAV